MINPIIFLWIGQGISGIGTMVYTIALSWYVIEETKSPLIMGTVLLVGTVPKIILSILAGVIGDKISKKKLLIYLDLFRFMLTVLWGASLLNRPFTLTEIYIMTFMLSMIDSIFQPLYNSLIPELIKKDNLTQAASINQMIFRLAAVIAPAIAGFVIILLNFSGFVIINGITFFIAAASTMLIQTKKMEITFESKKENLFDQIKSGFSYFWNNKLIFWSVFLITLANIAVVSYNVNLVNLLHYELNLNSNVYGLVLTFYSLGSFIIILLLSLIKLKKSRGIMYILCLSIGGLLYISLIIVEKPIIFYIIFFLVGAFFAVASTISTVILFEVPTEEFRTRIFGIASISSLLSPIGLLVWGGVGSSFSSSIALGIAGVIILIVGLIGLKTPLLKFQ